MSAMKPDPMTQPKPDSTRERYGLNFCAVHHQPKPCTKCPKPDSTSAPAPGERPRTQLEVRMAEAYITIKDADEVMRVIDELTYERRLDARHPVNDARLNYSKPFTYLAERFAPLAEASAAQPKASDCEHWSLGECAKVHPQLDRMAQPKPDSTSALRVDLTVTCPDCAKVFEATPLVPENFVTPEFTELVLGFAKIGKMLNGPARPIMEQIYDAMEASAAQPKAVAPEPFKPRIPEYRCKEECGWTGTSSFAAEDHARATDHSVELVNAYPAATPEMEARVEEIRHQFRMYTESRGDYSKQSMCSDIDFLLTTLDALREGK